MAKLTFTAAQRCALRDLADGDRNDAHLRDWFATLTSRQRAAFARQVVRLHKLTGPPLIQYVRARLPASMLEEVIVLALVQFDHLVIADRARRAGIC